jgi:hypothetical protein
MMSCITSQYEQWWKVMSVQFCTHPTNTAANWGVVTCMFQIDLTAEAEHIYGLTCT